jgi:hypothetical protein
MVSRMASRMDTVASFVANGSPTSVSDAIETFARAQGHMTALVVPWESTPSTLSMAVTAVKIDGWAIEHTNLGTITLSADGDATRVAIAGHTIEGESRAKLARVFDQFARDLQQRLGDRVGDRLGDRPR